MSVSKTVQSLFKKDAGKLDARSGLSHSVRLTADILRKNSGVCRCGDLTVPVEKVGHLCKCIRCGREYFTTYYNLGRRENRDPSSILAKDSFQLVDMDYYDAAVDLLRRESRDHDLYHYFRNYRYYLTRK